MDRLLSGMQDRRTEKRLAISRGKDMILFSLNPDFTPGIARLLGAA
jgi:hypothetical protein